jgi:hypothetical protein
MGGATELRTKELLVTLLFTILALERQRNLHLMMSSEELATRTLHKTLLIKKVSGRPQSAIRSWFGHLHLLAMTQEVLIRSIGATNVMLLLFPRHTKPESAQDLHVKANR